VISRGACVLVKLTAGTRVVPLPTFEPGAKDHKVSCCAPGGLLALVSVGFFS
jgi:hypothetical protein